MPVLVKKWLFISLLLCTAFAWQISPLSVFNYNFAIHFVFIAIFFVSVYLETQIPNSILITIGLLLDLILHGVLFENAFLFILLGFVLNFYVKNLDLHRQYVVHIVSLTASLAAFFTVKTIFDLMFNAEHVSVLMCLKSLIFTSLFYAISLPALQSFYNFVIKRRGVISR